MSYPERVRNVVRVPFGIDASQRGSGGQRHGPLRIAGCQRRLLPAAERRQRSKDGYADDLNPAEAAAIEADMKSRVAAKGKFTDSMYSVTATSIPVYVHVITNGSTGSLPAATTGKQISVPQQCERDARG
jgi:hypothetical protein